MVRQGKDSAMLDQAKAGDKVRFNAEEIGGHYVVTRIAPEPAESELKRAGYAPVQKHALLPNQYFLVFQPAKS